MAEIEPNTSSRLYQTNEEGVLVEIVDAFESPEEPGVYLIPRGCITVEPPSFVEGEQARWEWTSATEGHWIIEPVPESEGKA